MAFDIFLGKDDVQNMGVRFVVANVPVFAMTADPSRVYKMSVKRYDSIDLAKDDLQKSFPFVLFDLVSMYPDKIKTENRLTKDQYVVRFCKVTPRDIERLKANLEDPEDIIYSFKWDLSCWQFKPTA